MKQYIKFGLIAIVIALFIGTFVFLYMKSRPKEVVYEDVTPTVITISKSTVITGKIEPRDEVQVKPQINGIITELLKEAGDMVTEGEVIAKIKVIPDMNQLSSAESRLRSAQIDLNQAEVDYQREKNLYDKGLVSAEEYDKYHAQLLQARESKASAQEALEVVRDGVSSNNANASSTLVRSTISGQILNIPVKVGNSVILSNTFNDGTTIATVADMTKLIFRGNIDETEVGQLSNGMLMNITIGALEKVKFDALLEYISPKAVETNGANQFELKAAITVPDSTNIRSGYSANAEIILQQAKDVLSVPESTIEFEGDNAYVYVKKGKGENAGYERRKITTGLSDGVNIEVKSGLKKADTVRGAEKI